MSDGTLSIRRRQVKAKDDNPPALDGLNLLHTGSGAVSKQKPKAVRDADEVKVSETQQQKRLKPYDRLLKNFKYSAALDSVLRKVGLKFISFDPRPTLHAERASVRQLRSYPRADPQRWSQNGSIRS